MRNFYLLILVVLLTACSGVKKTDLVPLGNERPDIVLHKPVELIFKIALGETHYRLAPGNYAAIGRDDQGIYYIGPKNCITMNKKVSIDCGIYIPDQNKDSFHVAWFQDDDAETVHPYGHGNPGVADHLIQKQLNKRYHVNRRLLTSLDVLKQ